MFTVVKLASDINLTVDQTNLPVGFLSYEIIFRDKCSEAGFIQGNTITTVFLNPYDHQITESYAGDLRVFSQYQMQFKDEYS